MNARTIRGLRNLCAGGAVLAIANFAVFVSIALALGGDAINGKVDAGRFYLGSHGRYTEVSPRVFAYSQWHAYSVFVTHSLAFIGAFVLTARKASGRGRSSATEEPSR